MLVLNEDQRMLMESARGVVAASSPVSAFRKLRAPESGPGFSPEFWTEIAGLGWTGVLIPEAHGGIGFGAVGAGLIARELARSLALSPFLASSVLAASALVRGGADALKREWLPAIASGKAIVALAVDEEAKANAVYQTRAVRAGGGWRLGGVKHFVLDGQAAEALLVAARDEEGVASLYLVRADAPSVQRDTRVLMDGRRVASVRFDGVEIGREAKLEGGAGTIDATLDIGRAVLAASLCGVAEEAFRRTLDYLKQRRQFDRTIGSFQALQHRAAKMHIDIENAWSASLKALEAIDAGAPASAFEVAVAKAKAGETAETATAECLQMHGGVGMTDEYDIGLYLKRARVEATLLGDSAYHADRVATMLGY